MKRQPIWDEYEVALLVDAYIRISENGENKKEVLQVLSSQLRKKAQNAGIEIDETYRNLNGMMWQIGFIECAFKKTGYGKHMPSKLFQRVVDMYQYHYEEFKDLYMEALVKIGKDTDINEEKIFSMSNEVITFEKWLIEHDIKDNRAKTISEAFEDASVYAMGHRISKTPIWNIESVFEINQFFERLYKDKIFKVIRKDTSRILFQCKNLYLDFMKNKNVDSEPSVEPKNDEKKIVEIVAEKYIYGYRLGSVIERMRLRQYLSESNITFDGSDDELENMITKYGFISNGKLLIESENKNEKLKNEIEKIFETGARIVYYESIFESRSQLMEELHITSSDSLKDYMKEKIDNLIFSKNYFSRNLKTTEDMAVGDEIIRVWGNNVLASVDELAEKLSFIPYEKVRFYLSQNKKFGWVSEGVYTRVDLILITMEEIEDIKSFAASEIERKGYMSLSEMPLDNIKEENYELSEYAVLFGTYEKCLSEDYCLRGRIVTKTDTEYDATSLMKQFCSEQEELTLDEAISKVAEFTGVADRRIAYPVLYDSMIRVSEQLFVSQSKIHFDIEKIDNQIERFAQGGFIALKEITTFALFPECGFTWNHYILESFCYRFSRQYSYRTNLFNGKNAGAVVKKDLPWDYQEIMAQAVARSTEELSEKKIGKYLSDTGYMARSKFSGIKEICERANKIREEKN